MAYQNLKAFTLQRLPFTQKYRHNMAILRNLFMWALLLCSLQTYAQQNLPVYSFLKDDTVLRKKLYDQSLLKKNSLIEQAGTENKKVYKGIYDDIFESIGSMWKSSRVVTEPKSYTYLNDIVKKIVSVNQELQSLDLRIVFTRDWWPNAACMADGSIVFNGGLMVYLQNEAELAFILCHEIAHYYLQHNSKAIKKYVETVTSKEYQSELKRLARQEYGANKELEVLAKTTAFNSRRHSRDNESEADRYAYIFLKKTGYDANGIKTALELLNKIDDSLLYKPISVSQVFNFTDYAFKNKWVNKESAIFSSMDDRSGLSKKEKDSLKTHPDCLQRIEKLKDSIIQNKAGEGFIVNEKMFTQLKTDFFAEFTEECYQQELLSRNLYYSLQLLQDENKKRLGIYSIVRCLNDIYEAQKIKKLGNKIDSEDASYAASYNELLRLLARIRLEELANVNYYFCQQYESLMQDYPGFDKEILKARIIKNNYQ